MSQRTNRREDLLGAALEAFAERGYEGTSVADLAETTGLSKAAFVYHFSSKEELLFELAGPLLDDLDDLVDQHESSGDNVETLLESYLEALCTHREAAEWVDGDKSILNHDDLGRRLDDNNQRVHRLIAGPRPSRTARAQASAVLGMLWRPVRNGHLANDPSSRKAVVDLATTAATAL